MRRSRMNAATLAAFFFLLAAKGAPAWAEPPNAAWDATTIIATLQSGTVAQRTDASIAVFGAGMADPAVYAAIADRLRGGLATLDQPKSEPGDRLDELAWHAKALGGSGDVAYLPLLQQAAQSSHRSLARHAREAVELLQAMALEGRPFLDGAHVREVAAADVAGCRFVKKVECNAREAEDCEEALHAEAGRVGAEALVVLYRQDGTSARNAVIANAYHCPIPGVAHR